MAPSRRISLDITVTGVDSILEAIAHLHGLLPQLFADGPAEEGPVRVSEVIVTNSRTNETPSRPPKTKGVAGLGP